MSTIADLAGHKEVRRVHARRNGYFEARMDFAEAHEALVRAHLQTAGWICEPWGQALLSDTLRAALRRTTCPARWSPDLLAVNADDRWVFVDAKAEIRTDTPNFSLELSAFRSHEAWAAANQQIGSFVYVWDDLSCSYIEDLTDTLKVGEYHGSGSGTPFGLVPKSVTRPFASVFGAAS